MNRLLQTVEEPLPEPGMVYRTATFDAPPEGYMETLRLLQALYERACRLGDEELIARFKHFRFTWGWHYQARRILEQEKLAEDWSLMTHSVMLSVSFVTLADFDSSSLLEAIEAVLEEHVYGFETVPESFWVERIGEGGQR